MSRKPMFSAVLVRIITLSILKLRGHSLVRLIDLISYNNYEAPLEIMMGCGHSQYLQENTP